ncbi:MAG: NB-ARC domain-containing protein [Gammaproteobacteria bacterium]
MYSRGGPLNLDDSTRQVEYPGVQELSFLLFAEQQSLKSNKEARDAFVEFGMKYRELFFNQNAEDEEKKEGVDAMSPIGERTMPSTSEPQLEQINVLISYAWPLLPETLPRDNPRRRPSCMKSFPHEWWHQLFLTELSTDMWDLFGIKVYLDVLDSADSPRRYMYEQFYEDFDGHRDLICIVFSESFYEKCNNDFYETCMLRKEVQLIEQQLRDAKANELPLEARPLTSISMGAFNRCVLNEWRGHINAYEAHINSYYLILQMFLKKIVASTIYNPEKLNECSEFLKEMRLDASLRPLFLRKNDDIKEYYLREDLADHVKALHNKHGLYLWQDAVLEASIRDWRQRIVDERGTLAIQPYSVGRDFQEVAYQEERSVPGKILLRPDPNIQFIESIDSESEESYLSKLHDKLQKDNQIAVTQTITGMGGIGKTQLAIQYAYEYEGEYDLIAWINAETSESLIESYKSLLSQLHISTEKMTPDEIQECFKKELPYKSSLRWLLIYDNVENAGEFSANVKKPQTGGHIIVTSRDHRWSNCLEINVFQLSEAVEYLFEASGKEDTVEERIAAEEIAHKVGCLPLALSQVSAYIREEYSGSFQAYLQEYNAHFERVMSHGLPPDTGYDHVVMSVLDVTMGRLVAENPLVESVMFRCAVLSPDDIPQAILFFDDADDEQVIEAIRLLKRYSMITSYKDEKVSVHRLVQSVVRSQLEKDRVQLFGVISDAIRRLRAPGVFAFEDTSRETIKYLSELSPHVVELINYVERYNIISLPPTFLPYLVGGIAGIPATISVNGFSSSLFGGFIDSPGFSDKGFGIEKSFVDLSVNVAAFLNRQHQYQISEKILKFALEYARRENYMMDSICFNLFNAYVGSGQFDKIEGLFDFFRHDWMKAEYLAIIGEFDEAEEMYLALYREHNEKKPYNGQKYNIAGICKDLSGVYIKYCERDDRYDQNIYVSLDRYNQAKEKLLEALSIYEELHCDLDAAECYYRLGVVSEKLEEAEEAIIYYLKAKEKYIALDDRGPDRVALQKALVRLYAEKEDEAAVAENADDLLSLSNTTEHVEYVGALKKTIIRPVKTPDFSHAIIRVSPPEKIFVFFSRNDEEKVDSDKTNSSLNTMTG